jgi:acyl-CoA thioester hydrolase
VSTSEPQGPLSESVLKLRVAYADTDQGGVVHHATYLRYLEIARVEHMRSRGIDYAHFERVLGLGLLVVEANVRYKAGARFDDEVVIHTTVPVANRAKMRFDSRIVRGDTLLTLAEITLACVRMREGKLVSMPAEVVALAGR